MLLSRLGLFFSSLSLACLYPLKAFSRSISLKNSRIGQLEKFDGWYWLQLTHLVGVEHSPWCLSLPHWICKGLDLQNLLRWLNLKQVEHWVADFTLGLTSSRIKCITKWDDKECDLKIKCTIIWSEHIDTTWYVLSCCLKSLINQRKQKKCTNCYQQESLAYLFTQIPTS